MDDVIASAERLTKSYGSLAVLRGLDLELRAGQVLALLGPNGAGKTTTVKILTTLLRPDGGSARVAGHDVVTQGAWVRRSITLTGQNTAIDARLTGRENLRLLAGLYHLPRQVRRERVEVLLEAFDLADAAERLVATYSGGMQRRLDLAAGLLPRPRVLFLDEPTTGLDPRARAGLWQLVEDVVTAGTSVLLTTQYLEEADRLADRVALIDGGQVVQEGTPAELKRGLGQATLELELAETDARLVLAAVAGASRGPGGVQVGTDGSLGGVAGRLEQLDALGVRPQHWRLRTPTLDDVYLAVTGHPGSSAAPDDELVGAGERA